jgi:predicted MFS family arabinose efflux permease
MNFLSRLSYENILSPMILARSNDNELILGVVTSVIGAGGIVGGILVSTLKMPKNKVKMLFYSAAFSFAFGDLLMAFGQNVYVWSIAGIAASLPIPFTMAAQSVLIYTNVREDMQGRVLAVKNAMKFAVIPMGILLGGALSEYLFEPFVNSGTKFSSAIVRLLGNTAGTGMAIMFLCTGITGFASCMLLSRSKRVKELSIPAEQDESQAA